MENNAQKMKKNARTGKRKDFTSQSTIPAYMDTDSSLDINEDLDNATIDSVMESNDFFLLHTESNSSVQDTLHAYINSIEQLPHLSQEEIIQLLISAKQNDDKTSMMKIIVNHLRLVVWIAMTFQRKWNQNLQDLIQEGNLGLLRAFEKFEPQKGVKFSYYATFWIKAYILKYLMANWRLVKIGTTQTQRKLFYTLNKEQQKLLAMGFNPDPSILAQHFDVSEEHIIEMQQRLEGVDISVNVDPSLEPNATIIQLSSKDCIEDDFVNEDIRERLREQIKNLSKHLNKNELCILEKRILSDQPVTLQELGDELNISRERVRQIENKLVKKIRTQFLSHIDPSILEHITV